MNSRSPSLIDSALYFWLGASADAEEWRIIPSHPDYEASSLGRIRRGSLIHKGEVNSHGYHCVRLRKVRHSTHRLVCEAFHGPCPKGKTDVAHFDGDRLNNAAGNLRWATRAENVADAKRHGTFVGDTSEATMASVAAGRAGERNPFAKLTQGAVDEIRASDEPHRTIARRLGVADGTIRKIRKGELWPLRSPEPLRVSAHSGNDPARGRHDWREVWDCADSVPLVQCCRCGALW
jgi:hypothetical protein